MLSGHSGVDFDGDQFLGKEDLEQVINAITRNALTADEISYICMKVIKSQLHLYEGNQVACQSLDNINESRSVLVRVVTTRYC